MSNFLLVAQFLPHSCTSISMYVCVLQHDLGDTGQKAKSKRASEKDLVLNNCTRLLTIKA